MQHPRGIVRGELGGTPYTFKLNFAAIADIEAAIGSGLSALLFRLQKADARHSDIINVLHITIREGWDDPTSRPPSRDELLELIASNVDSAFLLVSQIVMMGFGESDGSDAEVDEGKQKAA